ncbi:SGNH/GDSL hydrolase family protein [Microtetraspora niveoalba]|uniref:SGNH/GDSL hydrolase family protein n=1 Tax=Microtetraspora niveoalba TaxID=46175 RepID=UPI0009FC59C9|nr:SGNH/GDSL hydrolase family protein [Microtetraspora niveoalba]
MREHRKARRSLTVSAAALLAACPLLTGCAQAVSQAARVAPPPAGRPPVVMFLGDSFTVGSGPVAEWDSYAAGTARALGWQLITAGGSGTGYVATGRVGRTFEQSFTRQLAWRPAPDLVVVSGGHNDRRARPATVRAAALRLVADVRKRWPSVRIVLVGPIWIDTAPRSAQHTRDAIASAAWLAGVPFLDPLTQRWITGDRARVLLPDGVHPTLYGHLRLARWLAASLRARGLAGDEAAPPALIGPVSS